MKQREQKIVRFDGCGQNGCDRLNVDVRTVESRATLLLRLGDRKDSGSKNTTLSKSRFCLSFRNNFSRDSPSGPGIFSSLESVSQRSEDDRSKTTVFQNIGLDMRKEDTNALYDAMDR